jgi:predicted nucleic acid-binding protein
VILPDVTVLVYAFREGLPEHVVYARWLRRAAVAPEGLLLTDLALTGFIRVVTNPRAVPSARPEHALHFVAALRASQSAVMARTGPALWTMLETMVKTGPPDPGQPGSRCIPRGDRLQPQRPDRYP